MGSAAGPSAAGPSRGPTGGPPAGARCPARPRRPALGWGLLTGALIAGYSLVNKVGVTLVPVPLYAFLVFLGDAVLVRLVQRWWGATPPTLRREAPWGRMIAVGVLMMGAYLAVLVAMSQAPVSYVVAAREVSVGVAALG